MPALYLLLAILFEVSGTTCMKLSHGFENWKPSVMMVVFYVISFTCLTLALKTMDISIAYAIWAGLGTALIALIGIVWFQETVTTIKIVSIVLVILGIVGLNLGNGHAP